MTEALSTSETSVYIPEQVIFCYSDASIPQATKDKGIPAELCRLLYNPHFLLIIIKQNKPRGTLICGRRGQNGQNYGANQ
jgi:hypothetical protein